ncbi:MAG: TetR/AcrR family transcriptional regulator [Solirubrobacteraceae bacterium]|nr:TetR/AcrR family transcriptional regulator [Patulibacter sp.]
MPSVSRASSKAAKPRSSRARGGAGASGAASSERARRRDAEVLAAATKVFYDKSYADSSVQDVADELGILKGSLYHYIKTKEDLLSWLVQDVHDDVEGILAEVQAVEGLDPLDRLELYIRKQIVYNAKSIPRITVYHHDADQLSAVPRKELRARQKHSEQFVIDLISEAQARGEVSPSADAKLLSNCVFATMIWMYRWFKPGGRVSIDELTEVCVGYAMAGVRGYQGAGPKA